MLAVIVLLVTCLIAGSTATKSSGYTTHSGYRRIVSPKPIIMAPRRVIRHYVGSRPPYPNRRVMGPAPAPAPAPVPAPAPTQPTRVVRGYYYSPTQMINSGFSQNDNSFSSFGAGQGIGQAMPMQNSAFMIPNYPPIQASPSYYAGAEGDDSGLGYSSNTIPYGNSFSSFGTGQAIPMQGQAFNMPNYQSMQASSSYNAAVGDDSGFEYSSNTNPLVY